MLVYKNSKQMVCIELSKMISSYAYLPMLLTEIAVHKKICHTRTKYLLMSVLVVMFMTTAILPVEISAQQVTKYNIRKPKNGNTYVIAHRGAHRGIPENTLAAYQKAIELGCDFVEIDIRKSKGGRFVSVHNETIDKYVEGLTGKVRDFTLAELKQMNIGKRVGPQWENERIPTFEEILELCKGKIGIYLDLKEPDVKAQIEIIRRYGMERDVIWYIPASHMKYIMEVKENCPECIPMPDPGEEKHIAKVVDKAAPALIATDMGKLSESFVKTAHDHGAMVFTDDKKGNVKEWKKILQWGTDGIQTDDPELLIGLIRKKD